jgi:hypothetical protein
LEKRCADVSLFIFHVEVGCDLAKGQRGGQGSQLAAQPPQSLAMEKQSGHEM